MAITNFIPTVWSETLYQALDKKYVAVANCNRDFEGDIAERGSVVKICGVSNVTIGNYTKNSDMNDPQTLSDTVRELTINQAKYFNFQIDDVDRAQSSPKLMDAAMKIAADNLANTADMYVFQLYSEVSQKISATPTADTILDIILKARERLAEQNVSDFSNVVLEVSPWVATMILKAKIALETDNVAALQNGYLGSIGGCPIFVSNNVFSELENGNIHSFCYMRTKRAIAFAEQLSEVEAYRPEKRFADAVKGLHLYGAKIVYPNEIVVLNLDHPAE